jgi:endoglucanase
VDCYCIIFELTPWALPDSFSTTLTSPLPFSNIVYSFHIYKPDPICSQGFPGYSVQETFPSPSTSDIGLVNATALSSQMNVGGIMAFQQKFNVPIYVGEFNCLGWAPVAPFFPSASNCAAAGISLFESHGWVWSYHAWGEYYGCDAEIPASFF